MADRETQLIAADNALAALRSGATGSAEPVVQCDTTLFRFMLASEATWKAARTCLLDWHGFDETSPKAVARQSVQVWLLGPEDAQLAIDRFDDRNLIVHTYNERLAEEIATRIPACIGLLERWIDAMRGRFDPRSKAR